MPFKKIWTVVRTAAVEFISDDALTLAAALAFYTILSLAPLLILAVLVVGLVYSGNAQEQAVQRASEMVGPQGGETVRTILQNASQPKDSIIAAIIGFSLFLFSASGVFGQLQYSLNRIWGVRAKSDAAWWDWLRKRFWTLVMMGAIWGIFIASIVAATVLSVVQSRSQEVLEVPWLWASLNQVLPLLVFVALFALMFKILPDVNIQWKDVWLGAAITAILFVIGRYLIGWYLGRGTVSSVYGAAGSLVVLLTWLYYSALIFFFGAELTQAYGRARGVRLRPNRHAEWIAGAEPETV